MIETTVETSKTSQTTAANADAVRHFVYDDLEGWLPVASIEQAERFMSNLGLRELSMRLIRLRVTPDIGEATRYRWPKKAETERRLNLKYGDRLGLVPGFYRRGEGSPWRLNLPERSALFFYGDRYTDFGQVPVFYKGVLIQPLDRPKMFYLLSSAKYDGPKAARLSSDDYLFFTQFED